MEDEEDFEDDYEDAAYFDEDEEQEVVCGICTALEQQQKEEA